MHVPLPASPPSSLLPVAVCDVWISFDKSILKTNFYQPTKAALSLHLAPDFLPEVEYPKKPFGMFFIIGLCPPGAPIVHNTLTRAFRQRALWVPHSVQGCYAWRYPYHHVEEQGVRMLSLVCFPAWLTTLLLKERDYPINQRMLYGARFRQRYMKLTVH